MITLLRPFKFFLLPLLFIQTVSFAAQEEEIAFNIQSPRFIHLASDKSSFVLTFTDFVKGAVSGSADVNYTVRANKVERDQAVIQAGLDDIFPAIELQADFVSFENDGGNTTLAEASPGYIPLLVSPQGLAHKGEGRGSERVLSGKFLVRYRAVAQSDLPATGGPLSSALTISMVDA